MDNFVVDLDKVLDEFEESEHREIVPGSCQSMPDMDFVPLDTTSSIEKKQMNEEKASICDESVGIFDLSEANFGPSVLQYPNEHPDICSCETFNVPEESCTNFSDKQGYFIPEVTKSGLIHSGDGSCNTDYTDDNSVEYNDNEKTEILQTVPQLQAHVDFVENRPSFMSSSPPGIKSFTQHGPPVTGLPCSEISIYKKSFVNDQEELELSKQMEEADDSEQDLGVVITSPSDPDVYIEEISKLPHCTVLAESEPEVTADELHSTSGFGRPEVTLNNMTSSISSKNEIDEKGFPEPLSQTELLEKENNDFAEVVQVSLKENEIDNQSCNSMKQTTLEDNNRLSHNSLNTDLNNQSDGNSTECFINDLKTEIKLPYNSMVDNNNKVCTVTEESNKENDEEMEESQSVIVDNILSNSISTDVICEEADSDLVKLEKELESVKESDITRSTNDSCLENNMESTEAKSQNTVKASHSDQFKCNTSDTTIGSVVSLENFLAPSVMSPEISTPKDDPGLTKVPGFTPEMTFLSKEDEDVSETAVKETSLKEKTAAFLGEDINISSGARPKDPSSCVTGAEKVKKNRPSILLGLSKPDFPQAKVIQNPVESQSEHAGLTNVKAAEINPLYLASLQRPGVISVSKGQRVNSTNNLENKTNILQENQHFSALQKATQQYNQPRLPQSAPSSTLTADSLQEASQQGKSQERSMPPSGLNISLQQVPHEEEITKDSVENASNQSDQKHFYEKEDVQHATSQTSLPTLPSQSSNKSNSLPQEEISVVPDQLLSEIISQDHENERLNSVENAAEASEYVDPHCERISYNGDLEAPPGLTVSPGSTPGMMLAPPSSSNPVLTITDLGKVAPTWMPDAEASNCLQCDSRFTFTKRRHHCRACGKVFCHTCCNLKNKLQYMEFKEARVCSKCYQDLIRAQVYERMGSHSTSSGVQVTTVDSSGAGSRENDQNHEQEPPVPNPNNPREYCSTIPPLQQNQTLKTNVKSPLSVMVPIGVLRKEDVPSTRRENRENKQVMFSDGIRPGGDLTELDGSSQSTVAVQQINKRNRRSQSRTESPRVEVNIDSSKEATHFIPESGLPPIYICMGENGELVKEENPSLDKTILQLSAGEDSMPIPFVVNKNLHVLVKIINMDCCLNRICLCFTSTGLCTVGQAEIVILLEKLQDEKTLPLDIFRYFQHLYEQAAKGNTVSNMDHSVFTSEQDSLFLGSQEYGGFLYLSPSFQCLNKIIIPKDEPYLFGLLLQKWEVPWAKVFPLRLMLRLGAEFRYYPCPLVSIRCRKPVYGEIGHTIMNLLVDFRNYQYSIPCVRGFTIHMRKKKTYLSLPRNRYRDVAHVLSSGNEHVMAVGATFSNEADSYLVCIQNDEGNYETQAINIQSKPREVTGATFVVFNGALKPSSPGVIGKSSIVEDGLMVQVLPEWMSSIREALRNMNELTIPCGGCSDNEPEEEVIIQWVDEDRMFNMGQKSPIDNLALQGVESIHIHNTADYCGPAKKAIRWTEVFFLQTDECSSHMDPVDLSRLAETLAASTCVALATKLNQLAESGYHKIGLRATINNDNVGYECGANGQRLPDFYMNMLDNELIPVIHAAVSQNRDSSVLLELVFHIINT